jgi:hypothetical protein
LNEANKRQNLEGFEEAVGAGTSRCIASERNDENFVVIQGNTDVANFTATTVARHHATRKSLSVWPGGSGPRIARRAFANGLQIGPRRALLGLR